MIKLRFTKIFIFITFTIELFFCSQCLSSFEDSGVGARYEAMGGTSAGLVNTSDAIFLNSSGLAQINRFQFSFYYANLFGIKELSHGTFSGNIPIKWGAIGVGTKIFGNKIYRENEFLFCYANSVRQKFYYGLAVRYMKLAISNYGSDATLGLDMGFIAHISSHLKWGFSTRNLNRPKISSNKQALPQIFKTGVSLNPVNNVSVNFDIYKDIKYPTEVRFGIEYLPFNCLALRCGFITEQARFTAGIGIQVSLVSIDYAFKSHSDLGFTHQFSLNVSLSRKKDRDKQVTVKKQPIILKKLNINTATKVELQQLKGIGSITAERIIRYREENGPFKNIEELKNVKGIGDKSLEKIRSYITVR